MVLVRAVLLLSLTCIFSASSFSQTRTCHQTTPRIIEFGNCISRSYYVECIYPDGSFVVISCEELLCVYEDQFGLLLDYTIYCYQFI